MKKRRKKKKRKTKPFGLTRKQLKRLKFTAFMMLAVACSAFVYRIYHENANILPGAKISARSAFAGLIPEFRHGADSKPAIPGEKTLPGISFPFGGSRPAVTFVLDDMGHTREHLPELERLGRDVTYAVLPLLKHSVFFAAHGRAQGAEVILHLPLESIKGTIPGPGLITSPMSDAQVLESLRRNLASVPGALGVNNHMGSKGTSDQRLMRLILGELKTRGLFFLDSKTSPSSIALPLARQMGLRSTGRDIFLDNQDNREAVRQDVRALEAVARRQGYGVGIGHYRLNTLAVLLEEIPRLKRAGFQIVPLAEIIKRRR